MMVKTRKNNPQKSQHPPEKWASAEISRRKISKYFVYSQKINEKSAEKSQKTPAHSFKQAVVLTRKGAKLSRDWYIDHT